MKLEGDEKLTWGLLTLIWFSAFALLLYALVEHTYNNTSAMAS